ncbi:hypothetical protein AX777_10790 [Sphingobium yanoikuyae]|jgi:hypothetical protein|uniref:Uncharacterized protein n=1 Tax=Sphingobium yanoikuyae TaxID=13690 RepID=A0A177JQV9_SPHYA|nr:MULTISPECIES: hypothetical protein [Sphingobium]KZC79437.1 hypothetical protein AYR46_13585 [Sphingobium yanoikuyae]OAH43307.1 hypothetical protein AX777_10790 [Sphingobium yanoikuyae]PHP18923.1 hypothetical protein CG471_14960 [Sphingobium sp. IP1]
MSVLIDPAFPMVLRNDAVRVHRNAVRRDFAVSKDTYDLYALAGLTKGEENLWAKFSTLGQGKARYDLLQKLIARQPALRLGLLLDDLAEALLLVGVADLRTCDGALLVLEWIDDNFGAPLLPPSVLNDFRPKLRALRRRRFGWVVPPQSGGKDHGAAREGDGPMEYPRVWLSEAQLERYRADADWAAIFDDDASPGRAVVKRSTRPGSSD